MGQPRARLCTSSGWESNHTPSHHWREPWTWLGCPSAWRIAWTLTQFSNPKQSFSLAQLWGELSSSTCHTPCRALFFVSRGARGVCSGIPARFCGSHYLKAEKCSSRLKHKFKSWQRAVPGAVGGESGDYKAQSQWGKRADSGEMELQRLTFETCLSHLPQHSISVNGTSSAGSEVTTSLGTAWQRNDTTAGLSWTWCKTQQIHFTQVPLEGQLFVFTLQHSQEKKERRAMGTVILPNFGLLCFLFPWTKPRGYSNANKKM